MGTCFVSGRRRMTKMDMTMMSDTKRNEHPPPEVAHRSQEALRHGRRPEEKRLTHTTTLCPTDGISSGNSSLGTSHEPPQGAQDVRTRWSPTINGAEEEGGARCSDLKLGIQNLQTRR
jgi:hypothetical protein